MASIMGKRDSWKLDDWDWIDKISQDEISLDHAVKVTHLNFPTCPKGFCRINCKKNPNCLNKLGETFWLNEVKDNHWTSLTEDPEEIFKRKEGNDVGLQNLGATCYINTFLQLWFHNDTFRSAIFKWNPPGGYILQGALNRSVIAVDNQMLGTAEVSLEPPPVIFPDIYGSSTSTIILSRLQLIFAMMKESQRSYIDPRQLVEALNLQEHEQQDAQEFSNLFMSLIQDGLQIYDASLWTDIESQFSGKYSYVTRCMKCGTASTRQSPFSEIVLSLGHLVLHECIKEFLKEEKLEGDNKYNCVTCNAKRDATRRIQLDVLPPVLSLQLLRFVYDRETWTKRKVNTSLQFPRVLNMNEFITLENESDGIFLLTAVLLHKGLSANSGHYVARIKDSKTDTWFSFDDKEVCKAKPRSCKIQEDDDVAVLPTELMDEKNKPKQKKGCDTSKNAYMLVYTKQSLEKVPTTDDVGPSKDVQEFINHDNKIFLNWIEKIQNERNKAVMKGQEKQKQIVNVLQLLPEGNTLNCFDRNITEQSSIVPTDWLKKWMSPHGDDIPPINTIDLLCHHGKLHFQSLKKIKQISKKAADCLYDTYGGDQKLDYRSLCIACVIEQYNNIKYEKKISEDKDFLLRELKKKKISATESFWVGKTSLRHWKGWALSKRQKPSINTEKNSDDDALDDISSFSETSDGIEDDNFNSQHTKFNKDILCKAHGKLSLRESSRQRISEEAWQRLRYYFPSCPEFPGNTLPCQFCQESLAERERQQSTHSAMAFNLRESLADLYNERNRPFLPNGTTTGDMDRVYVVSKEFLQDWKRFIKQPYRQRNIMIDNSDLVCKHDLLLYDGADFRSGKCVDLAVLLTEHEWNILNSQLESNIVVSVTRDENSTFGIKLDPGYCEECRFERQRGEFHYDRAVIYIQKLDEEEAIPAFLDTKEILMETNDSTTSTTLDKNGFRRSLRRKTKRDEYVVKITSSETLRHLKLKVMKMFSTMPSDQHLYLKDGTELESSVASLESLGIRPEMTLYLKVDKPVPEVLLEFGSIVPNVRPGKERKEEEGFKGTALCPR